MNLENPLLDLPDLDTKFGGCSKIEGFDFKEENPLMETQSEQTLTELSEIEVSECRKTLIKSTQEETPQIDDTQFSKTLIESVKDGEDAEFVKTLDESFKEGGENVELTETLENLVDLGNDVESESSSDKEEDTRLLPLDFQYPKCKCGEEEEEEDCFRRNRYMGCSSPRCCYHGEPLVYRDAGFPRRRPMSMMRGDYHNRRDWRRAARFERDREAEYSDRERGTELYRFPSWSDHVGRNREKSRYLNLGENEIEPCPVGAGLANLGNTCFLNAIVQCFTHTVPLVEGLLSLKHEASSHGDEFCVICAVRDQIEYSLVHSGRVISPSNLVDNLSNISSFFRRYQQEDAHEFLQCLLDKLDSNWAKYEASVNDGLPNYSSSFDDTLVRQIFGGRLVSEVCCSKCGHNSDTYEPLIDLSLEIEDVDSLESALKSFTKVESIEDTEKFTCDGCKEQVQVEKQLMLDQAPAVAAFHLKRFKSDGVYVEKIDKTVEYPLELDLFPYTKGSNDGNEELKYELFGIVVHVGLSSTSGHYFCYIRTSPDKWYRFDDAKVTRVDEGTVLCQDAYILFYARKGTPWFDGLKETWIEKSTQKIRSTSPKSVLDNMDLPSTSYSVGTGVYGCEPSGKRDAIGDHCSGPSSDLRQDAIETKAGVGAGPYGYEAGAKTDATGDTYRGPAAASELIQDMVETKVGVNARGSAVANANQSPTPSLSMLITDDVKEDKKTCERIGKFEETSGGTGTGACIPSPVENVFDGELTKDVDIEPSTPLRARSPDIYSDDESAGAAYCIPFDHVKKVEKSPPAKKSINTSKQDVRRKEAAKYVRRSMSSGRAHFFLAAMDGMRGDNSSSKKRRKQSSVFNDKHSPKKRAKISPKRVLRPLTV